MYTTVYPTAIPNRTNLPVWVDDVDDVEALVVNDPVTELLACLTHLGTMPAGSAADLTTRLAVSLNDDGSLKSTLSPTFVDLTLSGDLAVNGNDITSTGSITMKAAANNNNYLFFYTASNVAHLLPYNDSIHKIGLSNYVFKEGWFDKIACDGDLTLDPAGNDVFVSGADLSLDSNYYLQFSGDSTNNSIRYQSSNTTMYFRCGGINAFQTNGSYGMSYVGWMIGAYGNDNWLHNSSHGTGSTPLYIGNHYIAVSDAGTGGTDSAGSGKQYVELKIGATTYKILHDGTV